VMLGNQAYLGKFGHVRQYWAIKHTLGKFGDVRQY